jgi:hypothetical protein
MILNVSFERVPNLLLVRPKQAANHRNLYVIRRARHSQAI